MSAFELPQMPRQVMAPRPVFTADQLVPPSYFSTWPPSPAANTPDRPHTASSRSAGLPPLCSVHVPQSRWKMREPSPTTYTSQAELAHTA